MCCFSFTEGEVYYKGKPNNIPFDSAPKNICFYTYCKLKVKKWILRGVVWVRIVSRASAETVGLPEGEAQNPVLSNESYG